MNNADQIKFRASSLGFIMTEPRKGEKGLSETCKTHLVDCFVSAKYGRNTDIVSKYTTKGLLVEEDSLTLYSQYKSHPFFKCKERFENEYISGHPDIITPELIDIKSSWDIYTFFRVNAKSLNKRYYWQLQAYMDLTGATSAKLVYCLVNTPLALVYDEKRKLQYRMNVIDDVNKEFIEACAEIDKLSIYNDIGVNERVIEMQIMRNDNDIEKMHQRVIECREYMNRELFKSNLISV